MKGRQMAMDSLLREADRDEQERKKREWAREKEQTDRITAELDEKYGRMGEKDLLALSDGSVVIIAQSLFRNDHYTRHFYRTVMTFSTGLNTGRHSVFVQADNEEWPDIPPWAQVVNYEDDPRTMVYYQEHIHWATGEVTEPIITRWHQKYGV